MIDAEAYFKWILANSNIRDMKITPVYEAASIDDGPELPRVIAFDVEMTGTLPVFAEGNKSE